MKRRYDSIDIMKLYAGMLPGFHDDFVPQKQMTEDGTVHNSIFKKEQLTSHQRWNNWLSKCEKTQDISELIKVRYGLQVGMTDLVKKKLDDPAIREMFLRWCSSIERTARKIINKKHPIPVDTLKGMAAKKKRDHEIEVFLRKSSF